MEYPSFNHRYVPHHPLCPIPSDHDQQLRDFHHLRPPPTPPFHPLPPPTPLYPRIRPVPPPPPPFNPHQSNFTFLSKHSPPPPRVSSNRTQFELTEFDNLYPPTRLDSRPHPPRVSPYRPSNCYNPDFERTSRSSFRDEFIDPYRDNNQKQLLWDRNDDRHGVIDHIDSDNYPHRRNDHYRFNIESHNPSNSNTSEFVENYESVYDSLLEERSLIDNRGENRSWIRDGLMEMENNRDGFEYVSPRRVHNIYDSDKFSSRGREDRRELFHNPKKQIQKKSVLLRIGKPNSTRNRIHEQHFARAYHDDSINGSFRGKEKDKDPSVFLNRRIEEEREGSPVDLDVSFKSNSLVAKAIVASPLSPAGVSDKNLTPPRNRKIRKLIMSGSPKTKLGEHSVKSNNFSVSDCPSGSEKTPKQVEKVTISGNGNLCNIASLPCSREANDSAGSSGVKGSPGETVSNQGDERGGVAGIPSYGIRKRKKVTNHSPHASTLQPKKKDSELVSVDSSTNSPPSPDVGIMNLEEKINSAVVAMVHDVVSLPSLNDKTVNKVDGSTRAIGSEKDNVDVDSGRSCLLDMKRNSSSHLFSSSTPLETKIEEGIKNRSRSIYGVQLFPNSDKVLTEFENGSTVSAIDRVDDDVGQQCYQNQNPLLLEYGIVKVSSDGMVSGNAGLSCPEEIKTIEDSIEALHVASNASNADSSFEIRENVIDSNIDAVDIGTTLSSSIVGTLPLVNGTEAYIQAIQSVRDYGNLDLSEVEETKFYKGTANAYGSYHDSSATSSSNSGFIIRQDDNIVSRTTLVDGANKQSCLDGDGTSMVQKNGDFEECLKVKFPMGAYPEEFSLKDHTCTGKRKRKASSIQSDLSSPRRSETPENLISSAVDADTSLSCSVEVLVSAEEENSSGARSSHVGSQPCEVGSSILHGNRTNEESFKIDVLDGGGYNTGLYGTSTSHMKKTKVIALHEKIVSERVSELSQPNSSLDNSRVKMISDQAVVIAPSIKAKSVSSISETQETNKTTQNLSQIKRESNLIRSQLASAVPRAVTGRSSLAFTTPLKLVPTTRNAKSRTWHRTDNTTASLPLKKTFSTPVPAKKLSPRKVGKVQGSSYIRKGNSLVRKSASVATLPHGSQASSSSVYWLNASDKDEIKKNSGSESRVGVNGSASWLRAGGLIAPFDKTKTPPLPRTSKAHALNFTSLPLGKPPSDGSETNSAPLEVPENVCIPKISEDAEDTLRSSVSSVNLTGLTNIFENQRVVDEGNSGKKVSYVKRKSNQLVAASNFSDMSVADLDKTQTLSNDGYYKRRKNQLVRTLLESHTMPRVAVPENTLKSEVQRVISSRSLSKTRFGKALVKMYKPLKKSSVWRLSNAHSSKKDTSLLQRQRGRPYLFPWKRATNWESSTHNPAYIPNNSSLSLISRKLLLSRKRDTIYTRSKHGFSLRISKLLSVGGSSLKWSKSIEKNSKRANEEATLAVAAVEKKKREQNSAPVIAGTKSRNLLSRGRVFRIGSVRYKMDPSRRTLQRISDEESSCSASLQPQKDAKNSYVPRRLVIGYDEYVRIGNGNQLIRDPKKRTRTLANEKVRWSLHTARLRLARKSKYCQFFTRFGKCNKDDGKCPYIHDPSKIAVCTKFLNGSCSNPDCKLTHKVIPERMQDCSYYLHGLCSNSNCPYRHVNVNTNASICEGFLKGYCADGNECRKKHTYVCPVFEATGICPHGSKCKLHHPKKRSKGTEWKSSREQKNARGRYFGARHIDIAESRIAVSNKVLSKEDDDIFCQEGKFIDYIKLDISDEEAGEAINLSAEEIAYIKLDISDEEAGETINLSAEEIAMCNSNSSELQVADGDDLTKPLRIMYKKPTTESSPVRIDSQGMRTTSSVSEESNCCK